MRKRKNKPVAHDDLSPEGQERRLRELTARASGWCVLIYLERPGDMAVLVPVAPGLRDYEVVSAREGRYDVWRRSPQDLVMPDLTLDQVSDWLRAGTPQDDSLQRANIARWLEETLALLGVPRRGAG